MPPALPRIAAAAMFLLACGAVDAATVRSVEILGLDEAMTENVRVSLSLVDAIGKDLRGRRLGYLVREADDETREALEPFGYYSPQITVERNRSDGGTDRSEEHTSELQSLMRISYAVFCLKKKK